MSQAPPAMVLLVEDDTNDVLLIQRSFRKANFAKYLRVVEDGDAAVAYLAGEGEYADRERHPLPALVLLDLKLPRRSGLEVLSWIRLQPTLRRIPVVALTSSRVSADVNRAYDLGINSYLLKPVSFDDLLDLTKTLGVYWLLRNERPDLPLA